MKRSWRDEDGDIKGQFLDVRVSTTRSEIPLNHQQNKNVMPAVCCVSISFGGAEGTAPQLFCARRKNLTVRRG